MLLNASEGDPQTATGMSEAISCWGGGVHMDVPHIPTANATRSVLIAQVNFTLKFTKNLTIQISPSNLQLQEQFINPQLPGLTSSQKVALTSDGWQGA